MKKAPSATPPLASALAVFENIRSANALNPDISPSGVRSSLMVKYPG